MLRARFSLELMEHGRTTFRRSGSLSLEVLRRFEAEAGFYVDSQAPLESLRPTGTVGCLRGGGRSACAAWRCRRAAIPHRPAAGFALSLEALVGAVEQQYRERPFTVLLATGFWRWLWRLRWRPGWTGAPRHRLLKWVSIRCRV